MPTTTTLWWVFLGGCVGTALRAGVTVALGGPDSSSWAATLTVNVLGALLLGVLMGWLRRRPAAPNWIRPSIGIGVLGSFTTYSTLAVEAGQLGRDVGAVFLVAYPMLSLLSGLAAATAGLRLAGPRRPTTDDAPC